jgi:hypothetical protein
MLEWLLNYFFSKFYTCCMILLEKDELDSIISFLVLYLLYDIVERNYINLCPKGHAKPESKRKFNLIIFFIRCPHTEHTLNVCGMKFILISSVINLPILMNKYKMKNIKHVLFSSTTLYVMY